MTGEWENEGSGFQEDAEDEFPLEEAGSALSDRPYESIPIQTIDGQYYLVLSGENPGSIVPIASDSSNKTNRTAPHIRNESQIFDSDLPLMLLNLTGRTVDQGNELLSRLHAEYGEHLNLGVCASLARHNKSKINKAFDCSVATVKIADPEAFLVDHASLVLEGDNPTDFTNPDTALKVERRVAARSRRAAYFEMERSGIEWIKAILEAQREVGANVFLTSGKSLRSSDFRQSLDEIIAEGNDAIECLEPGERLALNLTIPLDCILNETFFNEILNELLEHDEFDTWYIRTQWRPDRESNQLKDATILHRYKRLSELAEDEEKILILAQTGWVGWNFLGHGATGFSTGPSQNAQKFQQYAITRRRKGVGQNERFFEKSLLNVVDGSMHASLRNESDYVSCECRWCDEIDSSPLFSHIAASWHEVYCQGALSAEIQRSAELRRGGRRSYLRRTIDSALLFAQGKGLVGRENPTFLRTWRDLI
ncbi:hypothetical protein ACFWTE_20350 [Nocardiopsis sp. NPDC058631]|uniref:hypothetical protein n=1 Tax=Nocardiopsis sp. NPDC058631 TaxID=3346566 RepID=UPI00364A8FC5